MKKRLGIIFCLVIFFLIGMFLYNNLAIVYSEVIVVSDTATNLCNDDICQLPQLAPASAIGTNLNSINDWSPEWVFVDRMKNARAWIVSNADGSGPWSSGVTVPMDAFGYPLQIPYDPDGAGPVAPQTVKTFLFLDIGAHYPRGAYTLIFDGSGEVNLRFDASGTFSQTQSGSRHTVQIPNPSNSGVLLTITRSDSANPIRNIRFIMPGFENTYQTQPFHPLYLSYLKPFSVLRFMDWEETNDSPLQRWADRTTPSHMSQARPQGVALEHIIDLCNTANKDCWLTIPHLADDNYIRQFATLVHDRLNSNLKVYIEYSNEVWNPQFIQYIWVKDNSPFQSNPVHYRRYARLSQNVFTIFRSVFSDNSTRVVRVLSGQVTNIWHLQEALKEINGETDAIAIAPYVGVFNDGLNAQTTSAEILKRMRAVIKDYRIPELIGYKDPQGREIQGYKSLADQYKIRLIAYEGGQHLLPTPAGSEPPYLGPLIAVQRDPDMYNVYREMLQAFFGNGGDLFMQFNLMSPWNKWGMWGALEWMDEDPLSLPKYRALAEWAGSPSSSLPLPPACSPRWICLSWSACSSIGSQTRTCTDANNCGITTSKPIESQTCTPPPLPPTLPTSLDSTRAVGPVRVDGSSLEWAGLSVVELPASQYISALGIPSGDADVSASVRSQWDDQNLYFLVQVLDDALVSDSQLANLWEDDSVELYLDGLSERATSYDANDFQFIVRIDNAFSGAFSSQALGVVHAVAMQNGGYTVEYAVPFSLLGSQASAGVVVGYDVGVNDDDNGAARDAQIMLHGDGNGWRDPSVFGRLRLISSSTSGVIPNKEKPIIEIKSPLEGNVYKNTPVQLQFSVFKANSCSYELDGVKGKEGCNVKEILNFASSKQGISEPHILKISATNANDVSELVVKFNYLQTRKAIIKYDKFRSIGKTVNLDDLKDKDLEDVPLVLDNQNGRIEFSKVNLFKNLDVGNKIDLDFNVDISYTKISLNSKKLTELNKPANLIFYNIVFDKPKILRDGVECSGCKIINYDKDKKELIIEVSGFSIYQIVEGKVEEPSPGGGNGGSSSGGSGGGLISDGKTSPDSKKKINSEILLRPIPLEEVSPLLRKIVLNTDVNYVEIEENDEALLQIEEKYYKVLFELSNNMLKLKVDDREYNLSSDEIARLNIGESEAYLSFKKLENKQGVVALSLDYDKIAEEVGLKKKRNFILIYLFVALLFLVILIVWPVYKFRKRK